MDLKSGYPWWAIRNGLMHDFPPLAADLRCDVAIVGGGITGALVADAFSRAGHQVAVLEQRDIGWGSSAVSTALLQYEIDTHLVDLARRYGQEQATLAYRACASAIDSLAETSRRVGRVGFQRCDSLYYASSRRHAKALRPEFAMREAQGFDVAWLDQEDLRARFGFTAPAAIFSRQAAQVDPYRLALRLFHQLREAGVHVHDRSRVEAIEPTSRGVRLRMD